MWQQVRSEGDHREGRQLAVRVAACPTSSNQVLRGEVSGRSEGGKVPPPHRFTDLACTAGHESLNSVPMPSDPFIVPLPGTPLSPSSALCHRPGLHCWQLAPQSSISAFQLFHSFCCLTPPPPVRTPSAGLVIGSIYGFLTHTPAPVAPHAQAWSTLTRLSYLSLAGG